MLFKFSLLNNPLGSLERAYTFSWLSYLYSRNSSARTIILSEN